MDLLKPPVAMRTAGNLPYAERLDSADTVIAIAGNPNVGKSTVFNALTGLNQHTGNWPGKTVENARGRYRYRERGYTLVDIPGTYSLLANSTEEEIARDFLCFGGPEVVIVVADATCLERNLNLALQVMEITPSVVLCVNLMDEAKKKKLQIDLGALHARLGIPVVGASARSGKGMKELMEAVALAARGEGREKEPFRMRYDGDVERAADILEPALASALRGRVNARWAALRLLDGGDESLLASMKESLGFDVAGNGEVERALSEARACLEARGIGRTAFRERIVTSIVGAAEELASAAVKREDGAYNARDRSIDRILTSKRTGIPIMVLGLFGILWLTISGANVPSDLLAKGLFSLLPPFRALLEGIGAPGWAVGILADGVFKTLSWVVSVMLPPMAIFFPLFTLLEDLGYLPRVAFNLDNYFRKACAHGKQALTMCVVDNGMRISK